jgi:hypothetical protein
MRIQSVEKKAVFSGKKKTLLHSMGTKTISMRAMYGKSERPSPRTNAEADKKQPGSRQ